MVRIPLDCLPQGTFSSQKIEVFEPFYMVDSLVNQRLGVTWAVIVGKEVSCEFLLWKKGEKWMRRDSLWTIFVSMKWLLGEFIETFY